MDKSFKSVNNLQGVPNYKINMFETKVYSYALVIPVLNENGRLLAQLQRIQSLNPGVDIVIADGGSDDGSTIPSQLKSLNVSVLLSKIGQGGLSAQLRMAFHYCLEAGYEGVITMDGNNKDGETGINSILDALQEGFDFVQGSRFRKGGFSLNTPTLRYLAIRFIHAPLTSFAAQYWYTDSTNGFRGHSRKLLLDNRILIFRDVFDTYELLAYLPIRSGILKHRIKEVPVSRIYPKREIPTKIEGIWGILGILRILFTAVSQKYSPRN
jgi:dolichol-phosphate mannosyltransferase